MSKICRLTSSRSCCQSPGLIKFVGLNSIAAEVIMKQWSLATVCAIVGIGVFAAPPSARADFSATLTNCNTSFGCTSGTGNDFGTVTVTNVGSAGSNEIQISVSLNSNYNFAQTGNIGFAFSLASGITGTISNITSVSAATWSLQSGHDDGMGTFTSGLSISTASCTGNCPGITSLTFDVTATAGTLSAILADFQTGGTADNSSAGYDFVADVGCSAPTGTTCTNGVGPGSTGLAGTGSSVPAPVLGAGLPGLLAACAGLVAFARRRRLRFA
jgi:hypothetical protein